MAGLGVAATASLAVAVAACPEEAAAGDVSVVVVDAAADLD